MQSSLRVRAFFHELFPTRPISVAFQFFLGSILFSGKININGQISSRPSPHDCQQQTKNSTENLILNLTINQF